MYIKKQDKLTRNSCFVQPFRGDQTKKRNERGQATHVLIHRFPEAIRKETKKKTQPNRNEEINKPCQGDKECRTNKKINDAFRRRQCLR